MTSVNAGVAALAEPAAGVLIALADQPLLSSADIDFLIDAFLVEPGAIIVPYCGGERGNPVVLPLRFREELSRGGLNVGCRQLIDRHPDKVRPIEAPNDHFVRDVDTPERYRALLADADAG